MREIKFRSWDEDTKRMLDHEYLLNYSFKNVIGVYGGNGRLMQFTGRRERTPSADDDQEIYEGDVVRCWGGEYCQGYWEHDYVLVIKDMINDCFYMGESEYVKVMGNIYQNPELKKWEEKDTSHLDHVCTGEPPF